MNKSAKPARKSASPKLTHPNGPTRDPRLKRTASASTPSPPQPPPAPALEEHVPPPHKHGFPVVGIGASAGGLEALEELLAAMPTNTGMAFVVVTHQHPGHTSLLPELLGKATQLPVSIAKDGVQLQPNHVYVALPGGHLALLNGVLHRMETEKKEAPHLPIDYFFRSLAQDQKERAICIILSGTGTDGTLGLKAIKGESGLAVVQQVQSAKYAGMPSSAVATGLADYVLPPKLMPKQLVAYVRGPYLAAPLTVETEAPALPPEPMQKIFLLLRSRTGHDFSGYKASTIRRRIERRMNLHQVKGPAEYVRYLQENAQELDILFKELLISVTSFFRDPEAFETLAQSTLPKLMKSRPEGHTFRLWVPGCSSGEEVFSLAILLRECMDHLKLHAEVQIFGTDLDNAAIENARNGFYPDGIAVDLSPQRLHRFFTREDGGYRIRKEIREMTVFAVQNVINDPPFTKLDLISCRNLLIYLNSDLQRRLLPVFHYALKPGGILMLGPSETIGGFGDLFDMLDKKWKIFRRKETALAVLPPVKLPGKPFSVEAQVVHPPAAPRLAKEGNIVGIVDRLLLARFAPASVVVSHRGDVVYIHGRTGAYLEPAPGQPRLNILDMAREGLELELASALRQAASQNTPVTREDVRVKSNGGFSHVTLTVAPIHDPEPVRGLLLVTFVPRPAPPEPPRRTGAPRKHPESGRVEQLERELRHSKESLQTSIEELETSNEELKSTNEELQSTNEELQSTNEELETSKEEMQSLNEELSTVNTEMQSKVDELSQSNDDMQNLLNSIDIATIFLDQKLNIKRYTEQARRLINLLQTDIGRPLGDLVSSVNSNLAYNQLVNDCREVLRSLVFKQTELQTKDGHWYLLRILPYRTGDNVIDGLVLTFVDINPVREAQRNLRRLSKVFTDGMDPMIVLDLEGRILELNDETVRAYGWTRPELLGKSIKAIVPAADHGRLDQRLKLCRSGEPLRSVDCRWITKSGQESSAVMTLSLLVDEHGQPEAMSMVTKQIRP